MGWLVNATLRPLYSRERDPSPIVQESRWASGLVWKGAEHLDTTPGSLDFIRATTFFIQLVTVPPTGNKLPCSFVLYSEHIHGN